MVGDSGGVLLSAFFWGYVIIQVPGGVAASRVGPKAPTAGWLIAVNLYGTVHVIRAALGDLRRRTDTAIVTIASVAAHRGAGLLGGSAYAASKSAVIGLTRSLARELGPDLVRANCIAPGPVDTAILASATPEERRRFANATLLGRPARTAGPAWPRPGLAPPRLMDIIYRFGRHLPRAGNTGRKQGAGRWVSSSSG